MQKGDVVPDFTLPDQTGAPRKLSDLLANGPVVLFFYPAAMTYGCTKESCHFRDLAGEFAAVGAQPVGISADTVEKQKQFDKKESLGFPLLSDPDREVAAQFGVKRSVSFLKVKRSTFVIDTDRTILEVHPQRDLHGLPRRQGARPAQGAPRCLSAPSSSPEPPRASGPPPPPASRAAGWRVIGIDKDETDIVADLSTPDGRRDAVARATEQSGGVLDGIVTCAGLAGTAGPGRLAAGRGELLRHGGPARGSAPAPPLRRRRRGHQLELDHGATRHPRRPRRGLPPTRRGAECGDRRCPGRPGDLPRDEARRGLLGAPQRHAGRNGPVRASVSMPSLPA